MRRPTQPPFVGILVLLTALTAACNPELGMTAPKNPRMPASGVATLHGVAEGTRPVSVTPPAGYAIDAAQREQMVDVRRNGTVSVTFVLKRN